MPTIDEIEEATTEYRSLLEEINRIETFSNGPTEGNAELTISTEVGRFTSITVNNETLHTLLKLELKDKQRQLEHLRREFNIE